MQDFKELFLLVAQRSHEVGARLALGADRSAILRLVMGRSLKLTIAGAAVGLMFALLATRLLSYLFSAFALTFSVAAGLGPPECLSMNAR